MKDINELLLNGAKARFLQAFFGARPYSPEGIVTGDALWNEYTAYLSHRKQSSIPYPWKELTKKTGGIRKGEVVLLTAGSGVAKSTFAMAIQSHIAQLKIKSAGLYLESSPALTIIDLMSPILCTNLRYGKEEVSNDLQREVFDTHFKDYIMLMSNNWNGEWESVKKDIRYFKTMGCEYIILDHVSRLVSGMETGDERRALDNIAHQLKSLSEELNVGIIAVVHLKRPDGKAHEEGGQTSLSQLRGSAGLAQLADIVIGLERNGQAEDETIRNTTTFRILKNRWLGLTGKSGEVVYDKNTCQLHEQLEEEIGF